MTTWKKSPTIRYSSTLISHNRPSVRLMNSWPSMTPDRKNRFAFSHPLRIKLSAVLTMMRRSLSRRSLEGTPKRETKLPFSIWFLRVGCNKMISTNFCFLVILGIWNYDSLLLAKISSWKYPTLIFNVFKWSIYHLLNNECTSYAYGSFDGIWSLSKDRLQIVFWPWLILIETRQKLLNNSNNW